MKILLFLNDKLVEFKLPIEVSGSFSFDDKKNEENKLINIEAINNSWYLYSTQDVSIFDNGQVVKNLKLEEGKFYELKRDNTNFLIYIQPIYEKTLMPYLYKNDINIVLGNTEECNIKYNCNYINDILFIIKKENNILMLTINNSTSSPPIYINKKRVLKNKTIINNGDRINVFGLNIFFLYNFFLINNPNSLVSINEINANIKFCILPKQDEYSQTDIKDKELYSENSFFSKSSRMRRFIETKEIKLDPPPKGNQNEDAPFLMVVGPMLTMGITSGVTLISTISRINSGETTMSSSWPQLATGISMLLSTMLWPVITKIYTKKSKKNKDAELLKKYTLYLSKKEKEICDELKLQQDILTENLITLPECLEIIQKRGTLFWNKRNDENDFLTVRLGTGNVKLDIDIKYPEEGFTIDEDKLKAQADTIVEKYKYINNAPVGYSLYENTVTAIMGERNQSTTFINNILLQLLTFYSYEDLKIVVFTNEEKKDDWNYIKYLYHNFSDDKSIRFFASDSDSSKSVSEILNFEINNRVSNNSNEKINYKPYYLVIVDDYSIVKKSSFIKKVTESETNLGCSILIIENKLSRLPSKCNNFISLTMNTAEILKNSYEKQEKISFNNEINPSINMNEITKYLSNIPIEFEDGVRQLPDSVNFLEMEEVGKVEQLNILNRWNTNNPTTSLKAEIGVDESGNLMYLDLHEKFHGPHGLIAGMTGSGKSEFIITYILSMAINYSPEYVSFILIDYKGGGLAGAFENKALGVCLPHLAGTITNLDKSEMDRTLVSIDSEIKRRQKKFNEARDALGESTIDIYKYQRYYREGKISEPISHLFIICDEFAELKSQQPDFMDNLISVARIGRSLGVHLILATQKPSGVVNDQIWSNTKFRVCLKVQDEQDSKEVLKKPDAALLKQVGRFYLQVGYDEYYALGQSAWCGAKYFPSNKIIKQVDKSINFINDNGSKIKSIQASSSIKKEAQGEQISAVMKNIIEVSNATKKKADRLWLENISPIILVDNLVKKYNINRKPYDVKAIIGEYDAPEKQEQGLLEYSFLNDGNTIIYGMDGSEREMLINSIIYSSMIGHTSDEINYYIVDYGSESLRRFSKFPSVGGMVFVGEEDKFKNLIKLIRTEISKRKKTYSRFGGEYINYINKSNNKEPIKVFIFNNFDSIFESHQDMYDYLPGLVRDSERYGIIFILTANASNSVSVKISQNFGNIYSLRLKDPSEYSTIFNARRKFELRDIYGRGVVSNGNLHEFQTSSIVEDNNTLDDFINEFSKNISTESSATSIPTLPDIVSYDIIKGSINDLSSVPIGISRQELEIVNYDFTINTGTIISSSKLLNITKFINNLIKVLLEVKNTDILFIDGTSKLTNIEKVVKYYYNNSYERVLESINDYLVKLKEYKVVKNQLIIIYGFDKFMNKLNNKPLFEKLISNLKENERFRIILIDDANKIKNFGYESWYTSAFSNSDGIWIGKGIADQSIFKIGTIKKEYLEEFKNNYGLVVSDGIPVITKLIEFDRSDIDEK